MNRQQVESSNVMSIGYENGVLEVEYKGGRLFKYADVPQSIYECLMSAPSKGKYLRDNVFGRYHAERILDKLVEA